MADHGAGDYGGGHSADTGSHDHTSTNHDSQFLPLQNDEQSHNGTGHHNGSDHNHKHHHGHGDNNGDLEAGYVEYGTINRGLALPHETTAAELWERHQQNRSCFTSDVFFALVVTFALAALALTWLTLSPVW
ncbi:hypothetical protein HII31_00834 [Pseudocercospora fuligena]|uniref:Uncharacterized protein n=1 Tax=Pseudocercospora fuligena TaxID=685502 RepID=A0A8H6RTS3_9PEZI|nr:hypothetical protein HII31_00834 [Pseudocercospora fuligena]